MSAFAFATARTARSTAHVPDRRLRIALWRALWLGAFAVIALPAARGHSAWLGWLPLWLVGMPACALWALHRFRLPRLPLPARATRTGRRRRGAQARRRNARPARPRVRAASPSQRGGAAPAHDLAHAAAPRTVC